MPELREGIDRIIGDLITLEEQDPAADLLQFRSLVSAEQFLLLYQLLFKYVVPGSHVLDWGCGNGHFSYFLLQAGYQTSSYSLADFHLRPYLEQLTAPCPFEFRQGILSEPIQLPYPDQKFDAVVSVGVLEHVCEIGGSEVGSLREIHRILKPGGYFLCYHLPNRWGLMDSLASLFPNKYHHPYRYTQPDIQALCQQSNFEIVELDRYGLLPRNLWGTFPEKISNSARLARMWDGSDRLLSKMFSLLCQNYLFVAQKTVFHINYP